MISARLYEDLFERLHPARPRMWKTYRLSGEAELGNEFRRTISDLAGVALYGRYWRRLSQEGGSSLRLSQYAVRHPTGRSAERSSAGDVGALVEEVSTTVDPGRRPADLLALSAGLQSLAANAEHFILACCRRRYSGRPPGLRTFDGNRSAPLMIVSLPKVLGDWDMKTGDFL